MPQDVTVPGGDSATITWKVSLEGFQREGVALKKWPLEVSLCCALPSLVMDGDKEDVVAWE